MRVALVAPSIWQTAAEQLCLRFAANEGNALVNGLNTAHNRHVGLPVGLAADLVAMLFNRPVNADNPWLLVKQRLQREVQGDGRHGSFPILLMAHRGFVVMRLALPLVAGACQQLGLSLLHHQDETMGEVDQQAYTQYEADVRQQVARLADSDDEEWTRFFQQRAITLAGLARKDAAATSALLPTPDPMAYRLWQELNLDATLPRHKASPTQQMNLASQHREVRKRREGGINGVYLTRRPEDLDHILISEFLNHRAVLAERLVNGGFLAYRRHPRREKLRHALVTAMIPPGLDLADPKLAFLKVCWLHAMGRFAWLLHRAKLAASEFRLIEGNSVQQVHVRAAVLADMPDARNTEAEHMSADFLQTFATALGWTPHLFETRPRFKNLDRHADREAWLAQVWREQADHPAWSRKSGKQAGRWNLSDYSYVHVALLLPQRLKSAEAYRPAALTRALGFARHGNAFASCLWVPDDWFEPWHFESNGQVVELSFQDQGRDQMASMLVQRWLGQWIGEMSRGA